MHDRDVHLCSRAIGEGGVEIISVRHSPITVLVLGKVSKIRIVQNNFCTCFYPPVTFSMDPPMGVDVLDEAPTIPSCWWRPLFLPPALTLRELPLLRCERASNWMRRK